MIAYSHALHRVILSISIPYSVFYLKFSLELQCCSFGLCHPRLNRWKMLKHYVTENFKHFHLLTRYNMIQSYIDIVIGRIWNLSDCKKTKNSCKFDEVAESQHERLTP